MNYEQGGIVITIAIVSICLSVGVFSANMTVDSSVEAETYIEQQKEKEPKADWSAYYDYYKNNNIDKQQCKQAAFDLQDYFDCVND